MTTARSSFKEVLGVRVFPRDEFYRERWHYKPGEHVTFLGPTQMGKTTLAFELLGHTATPQLPAIVLVVKPGDAVVTKWAKQFNYKTVRDWPPPRVWQMMNPPGWVVWPRHSFKLAQDEKAHRAVMQKALMASYKKGHNILFADEVFGLITELNLGKELQTIWSRGSSMGCGLWSASQRPFNVPLLAYSSASHLFVCNDPDKRDRDRYSEIGGV